MTLPVTRLPADWTPAAASLAGRVKKNTEIKN